MTITRRRFFATTSALWPVAALSCAAARSAPTAVAVAARAGGLVRRDHRIPGEHGMQLFARELRGPSSPRPPVLLLHGARIPGVASFDLPVAGGSLAADLAAAGHAVFVLDARGYGGSTRPPAMDRPPDGVAPLVRSSDVVRDVAAAVEWIRARERAPRVALFGWATGGHWLGHYASLYSDRVSHLVVLNTLYGGTPDHPSLGRGSDLEDPARPGQFHRAGFGAHRASTAASVIGAWDRSIAAASGAAGGAASARPGAGASAHADPAAWRDPAVAEAIVAAALASDPTSASRTPPSFRAPTGALEDSFYLATGRQLWDASLVLAPTLILRSAGDFWSRPEDPQRMAEHMVHSPRVEVVTIEGAGHFVHLERPVRGRSRMLEATVAFLSRSPTAKPA